MNHNDKPGHFFQISPPFIVAIMHYSNNKKQYYNAYLMNVSIEVNHARENKNDSRGLIANLPSRFIPE